MLSLAPRNSALSPYHVWRLLIVIGWKLLIVVDNCWQQLTIVGNSCWQQLSTTIVDISCCYNSCRLLLTTVNNCQVLLTTVVDNCCCQQLIWQLLTTVDDCWFDNCWIVDCWQMLINCLTKTDDIRMSFKCFLCMHSHTHKEITLLLNEKTSFVCIMINNI